MSIADPIDLAARLAKIAKDGEGFVRGMELDALVNRGDPVAIALATAATAATSATLVDSARVLHRGNWFPLWNLADASRNDPLRTNPVTLLVELDRVRDLVTREHVLAALAGCSASLPVIVAACGRGAEHAYVARMLADLMREDRVIIRDEGGVCVYSLAPVDPKTAPTLPAPAALFYLLSEHPSRSREELLWWAPKSAGYVIGLDGAGKYTAGEAAQITRGGLVVAVPCETAEALAIRVVPSEHRRALTKGPR